MTQSWQPTGWRTSQTFPPRSVPQLRWHALDRGRRYQSRWLATVRCVETAVLRGSRAPAVGAQVRRLRGVANRRRDAGSLCTHPLVPSSSWGLILGVWLLTVLPPRPTSLAAPRQPTRTQAAGPPRHHPRTPVRTPRRSPTARPGASRGRPLEPWRAIRGSRRSGRVHAVRPAYQA